MPLDPARSTRAWVAVHGFWAPHRDVERSASNDPPPSYAQAMGLVPAHTLPSLRAIPQDIGNAVYVGQQSYAAVPEHPIVQMAGLHELDEKIRGNREKLTHACEKLVDAKSIRAIQSKWFGELSGSGLFQDDPGVSERLAKSEIAHYEKKLQKLQDERSNLFTRSAGHPSSEQANVEPRPPLLLRIANLLRKPTTTP